MNDKCFLDISMTDASGRKTLLCTRCRKVDFAANVPYRDIAPGGEYAVSVPLCRMVPESTWNRLPAGTYTLEAAYHNHYGDDCLKGGLTTSCEVIIS